MKEGNISQLGDYDLPDIRKAIKRFRHIIEDDQQLKEVFPKGIKHFQVSERRGSKKLEEIPAPSTIKFRRNEEERDH